MISEFRFKVGDKVKLTEKTLLNDAQKDVGVITSLTIDKNGTYASVVWNAKGWKTLERESSLRPL